MARGSGPLTNGWVLYLLLVLTMKESICNEECDLVCEHGFIDFGDCSCVCRNGWHGADCGTKCLDARGEDYCGALETTQGVCEDSRFARQMEEQCAATCGFCEKFGPGSEGFVCETTCASPGGRLNSADCICECSSGWFGELCQDKCVDLSDNCATWKEANQCGTPFVDEKCPASCHICEPFGPGSPGFYCLLDCVNGGTLIETDRECRCECAQGWQGDQCDGFDTAGAATILGTPNNLFGRWSLRGGFWSQVLDGTMSYWDYVFNKCPVLCQRCDKFGPGAPGFECSLECLHGGVLVNNETNCFCQCPEEWSGTKCEESCQDSNRRCSAMSRAGYCENAQYTAWMQLKCPNACGYCHDNEESKGYGTYFLVHAELPRTEDEMRREKGMEDGGYQMTGPGIELVFLLDTSASIGEVMFKKQKQILLDFIDSLDFDAEGGIRALFLAFDTNTRLGRNLYDIHSREDARKSLESIKYEGGQSQLTTALRTARQLVFAHARENAKKVFYIASDGLYTGDRPVKFSQAMRAMGVEIFVLVMEQEGYNVAVLSEMTGDLDHIISVNSFNDIPLPYGHNDNITLSPSTSPGNK